MDVSCCLQFMDAGTQTTDQLQLGRLGETVWDAENAETPSDPWIHCEGCFQIHQYNNVLVFLLLF